MSKKSLKDKLNLLNEKFTLKSSISPKSPQTDSLQCRITSIRKKIQAFSTKTTTEMETLTNEAAQLLQCIDKNNQRYEQQAESQLKQLQMLTLQINSQIEHEIATRKQRENAIVNAVEKKIKFVRGEVEKERKAREQLLDQITCTLQKDVPSLMDSVLTASSSNREEQQKLSEILSQQQSICKEQLSSLKEKLDSNNNRVYEMIRELTLKSKKEVQLQRQIRQATHQELLQYVQQRCDGLQQTTK